MTAYEYIKNCVNVKLDASRISGVGVFALRNLEEGEEIFKVWKGESGEYTLTEEELSLLDNNIRDHLFNMYGYKQINGRHTMFVILNKECHWIFKTPLHWVNSCAWDEVPNFNRDTLKTERFIRKGEEILAKYGKYGKFKRTSTI